MLFHCWNVGHDRGALGLRHAESLKAALFDLRREGRRDIKHERDAAGEQIDHRLVAAARVVNGQDFCSGFEVEQFRRQVARGSGS